ncbi:MAG: sigma-54 dependent transcriptional regulator [Polyangia bacterium]
MRLLTIDDDEAGSRLLMAIFAAEGFEVIAAHDGEAGLARATADRPDVVILDLHLPGIDGLEVLQRLRAAQPALPVLMLTSHDDVKAAVRAMRLGAVDYLGKPVDHDEIVIAVRRTLEIRALEVEVEDLRRQVGEGGGLARQMGPSAKVRHVIDQVRTVASSSFSVLLLGETGTGKELVAQAVHRQSDRRARPLVAVDCGAIPESLLESELFGHEKGAFTGAGGKKQGRFHLAEGGTLFLDEVGNLPLVLQAKLLRVLESREVQALGATRSTAFDVRFIAATNDDLQAKIAAGRFRADLYFRLAQYTISLPPLRERTGDIAPLAQRFLEEVGVELRRPVQCIAPDASAALERHTWPGNVRELRNVIRQAVLESADAMVSRALVQRFIGQATTTSTPAPTAGRSLKDIADEAAREAERHAICESLRATGGNKSQAARALQTDYKTLHVKMKRLGVRAIDFMS